MKINIVGGAGVMGQLHASALQAQGHKVIISGRESTLSPIEAAQLSDITIISVPIDAMLEVIKQVAPHCRALMDFSSVKKECVSTMLQFARADAEIVSLHPLYGCIDSIEGQTIADIPIRQGEKCSEVIASLQAAGANIVTLKDADEHDRICSLTQNLRIKLLDVFMMTAISAGIHPEMLYALSPPPTRILIDLAARQCSEKNDNLYDSMFRQNTSKELERVGLQSTEFNNQNLSRFTTSIPKIHCAIRSFLGSEFLESAQSRAASLIALHATLITPKNELAQRLRSEKARRL